MSRALLLLTSLGLLAAPDGAAGAPVAAPDQAARLPASVRLEQVTPTLIRETFLADGRSADFNLAWRVIRWSPGAVRVEGQALPESGTVFFDASAGVCRLARPPAAGALVEITYELLPHLSHPTGAAPGQAAPLRTSELWGQAALRSGLRVERRRADSGGRPGLSLKLAGDQAGARPASDLFTELETGRRQTDLRQQLSSALGSGDVTYLRVEPVALGTTTDAREEFKSQLNLQPSPTSRLLVSNFYSRSSLFAEEYAESERRRIQYDRNWNRSQATLIWERQREDGYGVANALDALSLSLRRTVTASTSAEGMFVLRDSLIYGTQSESLLTLRQQLGQVADARANLMFRRSDFWGDTLESGLSLSARPGETGDVRLGVLQSDSELYGQFRRISGDFAGALGSRAQFQAQISQRSAEGLGKVFTYGLGLSGQPTPRSLLEAAFSESRGELSGDEESQTVRVSLDPSSAFRLQLGFDRIDSSLRGLSQDAVWIVTVGGRRYIKFEGYSGLYAFPGERDYTDALYRVEVRPVDALALSGSLREIEEGDGERQLAGLGATLRLLPGLDLGATYRQPRVDGETEPDLFGQDLRLSLAPVAGFRLFGQYSVRPEDQRGGLLDQTHRSLGLATELGSLKLEGSVTSLDDPLALDAGKRLDVLASLRLGTGTRFYGGFQSLQGTFQEDLKSRIYRVGISQTAGQSFFLLLEGQWGWLVDGAGARTWSPEDTRAQARLGLRF